MFPVIPRVEEPLIAPENVPVVPENVPPVNDVPVIAPRLAVLEKRLVAVNAVDDAVASVV